MRLVVVLPALAALLLSLPCRRAAADDIDDAAKEAERELASTPKRINAVGGLWMVLLARGRDAEGESWKKRVIAACKEPETIGCGHELIFDEDGRLRQVHFRKNSQWTDPGVGLGQAFTLRVVKDKSNSVFQTDEIGAVAGQCAVQGIGYGVGDKRVAVAWDTMKKKYQAMMKVEANLIIDCGFGVPFAKKEFLSKPFLWEVDAGKVLFDQRSIPVAHIFVHLDRKRVLMMMRASE